ncbi:hypothetical protein AVHY2522_12880 [Acidovorax sp. SUPP2522]|uniref:hypothetical protein n=1 Tax=unclassified Acidovorax TaxID=2684926 RepID=UPI002349C804|nr:MULTISPECIES: hypothetical protein [unclassified Acidovorax]WCM98073.1 hypothetical protein M5C96_00915 [Acidovorax sp. GBBC 1281]GKT16765.1 hypothetical protein AVHY2522_12880 [Acidovorax sp. SUPP2522]
MLDGATPLLKQIDSASPLSAKPHQLDTYITFDNVQNTVLVPAKELLPGLLRSDQFIELSSDRLHQVNALSTTHPGVKTQMPDTASRLRVISPAVAANLASAREVIDLVKALLPGGAGNQMKDVAATGGDSFLRSSLSFTYGGSPAARASVAIQWQGGYCDAHASLTYQLLSQNPTLKDSRIDLIGGGPESHVFVVIRGHTPEQDIVVDPWAPFASPTLVQDALPMHRELLGAAGGSVKHTKPAGTVSEALDIQDALRRQALTQEESIQKRFIEQKFRYPEDDIASQLKDPRDRWDVPFSGNPNVRYEVQDESGQKLTDFPLRFDMQRTGLGQQLGR